MAAGYAVRNTGSNRITAVRVNGLKMLPKGHFAAEIYLHASAVRLMHGAPNSACAVDTKTLMTRLTASILFAAASGTRNARIVVSVTPR